MKDSGKRQDFTSGAVRDTSEGKPRPDLISPFATNRLATWLGKGAEKYEPRNWEKGIPISRCLESLERHLVKYKMGLVDEDHMAAVACNVMFILHNEEAVKVGLLPTSMNDLPFYLKHIKPEEPTIKADGLLPDGPLPPGGMAKPDGTMQPGTTLLQQEEPEDEGSYTLHKASKHGWVVTMNYKGHTATKDAVFSEGEPVYNKCYAMGCAERMLEEYKETINAK